ncbi:MAG: MBL fold metallo-hydrolase [Deltaproteobacteria bacterium]|nr:MBL fold metallo-hydrolase [Deltaproteobacteria bacterium]MBW1923394.1 MBL fold metallo-hydrolase [Deltaproteobacteria bacterium]MBW1949507.1 MBL fold metallo-hydrolase [Deltaproteobacteria bacterium]MBW2007370.1 MBL fold metallo-hydrolase [Deltaproteobacteria bacterium]MBW2103130.1 MBL fold metallo-hydrolase [Deltaproteobacteria bacterium]
MKILNNLYGFIWTNPTANNCNTYFIDGEKRILIDPGHHHLFEHVREGLARLSLRPEDMDLVIVTHAHPDHLEGIRRFAQSDTLVALSQVEMDLVNKVASHYGEALGLSGFGPHLLLREGELHVGDVRLEVLLTPGHSPGSICLYWPQERVLFTGDVVFLRGVGRTDLPGGDGAQLKESIKRIAALDVEILLPGHGDIVVGAHEVRANFSDIERTWFAYL